MKKFGFPWSRSPSSGAKSWCLAMSKIFPKRLCEKKCILHSGFKIDPSIITDTIFKKVVWKFVYDRFNRSASQILKTAFREKTSLKYWEPITLSLTLFRNTHISIRRIFSSTSTFDINKKNYFWNFTRIYNSLMTKSLIQSKKSRAYVY